MTQDQVQAAVQSAIDAVRREARPINFESAYERSIAHRLAVHLEAHFGANWRIGCEYDRDGQLKKTLVGIKGCDEEKKTEEVLPDIIIHHREGEGRAYDLLVIEIKKHAGEDPCDQRKLELLTHPGGHYEYQLRLYINVDAGKFTCTWYSDGQQLR